MLPALPVQYADYAAWQRARLRGRGAGRAAGATGASALAGAPPRLELPTDRPRPAVASGPRRRASRFALPAEATRALRALARREGATLFMTLLAAWQLLLARYSGQDDVVVGTPVAGRARAETEGLIGFFVNTLVLRADLSGDPTFRALLGRVREAALGAYAHQDVPFEQLVEELQPERARAHTPLFQVMFALQNAEPAALRLGERGGGAAGAGRARRPVRPEARGRGGRRTGLSGVLTYRADLFDAATVERMLGHCAALLRQVAADAARPLSACALLADGERRQVLEAWNATAAQAARDGGCVHERFAAQAARDAGRRRRRASARRSLTYAELDARANRLAHHLRALRRGAGGARGAVPGARRGR